MKIRVGEAERSGLGIWLGKGLVDKYGRGLGLEKNFGIN